MSGPLLMIVGAVVAFTATVLLGKMLIPVLTRLHFGQTIRDEGPKWHKNKQGTPTMGGLMFIFGILLAVVACIPIAVLNDFSETPLLMGKLVSGLGMALGFGIIGFMDDYIGVVKKRNLGLTEAQKLVLQFIVAGVYLLTVRLLGGGTELRIPFLGRFDLGWGYYPLAAIVIVGLVNAVNFTDGVDGLNSTVTFFVLMGLSLAASLRDMLGIAALGAISAAACLGFLVWNFHPAKVFMGDTGSLFLGGMVAAVAFGEDLPILLIPMGIIYWVEILSVVLQVVYFKLTHGKRLFKMSPIHHHFELCGWSEVKICLVFGGVTLVSSALGVVITYFGV